MKKIFCSAVFVAALASQSRADTTLVFNEIMYHPATNEPALEWVELYNQLAVDLDVSGWRLAGDISYTFAPNSRIPGRGYVVVAINPGALAAQTGLTNILGPFLGRLNNGNGTVTLRNNADRLMDRIEYEDEGEWPVSPDGSGVSLSKRDPDLGSAQAANWTSSAQAGGTPGVANFALPSNVKLIAIDGTWKYEASGSDLGTAWQAQNYDDSAWSSRNNLTNRSVSTLFNTGVGANGVSQANGTLDPHYIITAAAQGTVGTNATVILNHSAWVANDPVSSFIGVVDPGTVNVAAGAYYYRTTFGLDGFILGTVQINTFVAVDNNLDNIVLNGTATGQTTAGFASFNGPFSLNSSLLIPGTNTLEFRTFNLDGPGANPHGFRAQFTSSGLGLNTNSPLPSGNSTYYFRKGFTFTGNPQFATLAINSVVADGAVFYLNGVEVYRQNMPAGPIGYSTPAGTNVTGIGYSGPIAISAAGLVAGSNVLAVEVHQAVASADGPVFGTELSYSSLPRPPVTVAFNEFSATTNATFWLELMNYGTNNFLLDGFVIRDDAPNGTNEHSYAIPPGTTLNAGQFLVLSNSALGFIPASGDKLFLLSPLEGSVYDGVVAKKGPRARYSDGTGVWLVPSAPTPGTNNSFSFRNEIVINEIMYHHKLFPAITTNIPPDDNHEAWLELYNRSTNTVDLTDWQLSGGVSYRFQAGRMLAPGAYLVVADDLNAFRTTYPGVDAVGNLGGKLSHNDDRIVLEDPVGNPADEVHYYTSGRWPENPDGGGSSLELRDPNADNSKPEAWAASDESGKSDWLSYSYRVIAAASATASPDAQWREFQMGLVAGGECLIDDISVVQNPTNAPVQYIDNGNFENGITGWRVLGNHGRSFVESEPGNPGNHVLHLVSSGPQEHMHNHIETTLSSGRTIVNGSLYEISFRAKWLSGNHLLNTRGYFNRIARTTPLVYPQLNGTPGARNSRYATNIGPTFAQFAHSPVVPQVSQPATVTVQAQDPQGVSTCEVFYSVNGGAWASSAMSLQGGNYVGTIPGQAASSLVQFYVRAVDGLGAVSTFPAAGPNSAALYRVFDGAAILAPLHNIRILMSPANVSLLHASTNVMSNEVLPATVIYDERVVYYDVGARLKSSERGRDNSARVGFHIEFHPDELFRGVHPVMLVDRSNGGSRPANEEIILRHLMLHAGVPEVNGDLCRVLSPRTSEYGTAILAPRFEDEFVEAQYDNGGDGTLFELELIYYPTSVNTAGYKLPQPDAVQGLDYQNLGGDKEPYRYNFIIKNHREADDYSRFIGFAKMFSLTGAQLDLETRQTMDLNQWMKAYAMISLCGVGDMYTFGNNHNFMTYIRPSDQKMLYFPWDMDFSFNNGATSGLVGNQNLANIVNLTPNLRCFYAHILDHVATTYNTNYMAYWIAHYGTMAGQNYSGDNAYIQARATFAQSQIANAAFSVNGTNFISTGSNLLVLTGTAPVQAKTITVNGREYPITWTGLTTWSLAIPLGAASNSLNVAAIGLNGASLSNLTETVLLTNSLSDPRGLIVFNEIMYNPYLPDTAYVELFNISSNVTFDLSGWRINGLDFTFPAGKIITPRQYVVVAASAAAYAGAYGLAAGAPIGEFLSGNLQNNGETLTLIKPAPSSNEVDLVVDKLRYESAPPWPTNANGTGSSLQLIDPNQENARVANWFSTYSPPVYCCGSSTPAHLNDGWRFVSVSGSIGNGVSGQMRLLVYLGPELGTALLDDIWVVAGTNAAVGTNYVRNGDFEAPLIDEPLLTNSWMVGTNYTNSLIVSDLVHAGSGAFKLAPISFGNSVTITATTTNNKVIYQALSPAPPVNTINTLSFWFWATNSSTNLTVKVLNSAAIKVDPTNINITITPSNYVPPQLVSPTLNTLSPGVANQNTTNLPAFPPLWINEVQAENITGITDSYGEHDPWIEIYNTSTNAVSLDGLFLSSSYTALTNWAFPPGSSIGPTQFLVVFCDGQAGQTSNTEYHTSFRLAAVSGSVALSRLYTNAPQVVDYVNYAGLHSDRSYGSFPDGQPFDRQEFFYVTPRGTNDGRSAPLTVFINEWVASNTGLLADPADGAFDDWFELYNPGTNTVDIAGYYLTDNLTNKFKSLITTNGPHTIGPHGFLLVWADNDTGQNVGSGDLHVNFQLSKSGEAIGIFAADGSQIDAVVFGGQGDNISQGRYPDGNASVYTMTNPTPRAPNFLALASNAPPVLDPIGNKIIYLGQTLAFTATASDSDLPAQVLTFSLDAGAPAGATIGNGTGAFSWTPSSVGVSSVTVRVHDSGVPSASDSETITIEVLAAPSFANSVRNGDNFELSWGTRAGLKYAVDYTENLNPPPVWTPLATNVASGNSLSFTNATTNALQRFFRIRTVE